MKKVILLLVLLNSVNAIADFTFINSEQKAGKGGNSAFGKSEGGSINNISHKDNNKTTNVNTDVNANLFKK